MKILARTLPSELDTPRMGDLVERLDVIRRDPVPYDREIEIIKHGLGAPDRGPVLEIGPGMGIQAFELMSHGYEIEATDTVRENVEHLQKLAEHWPPGFPVRHGDVSQLAYPEDRFAGVYALHVWEHVHDQVGGLRECARVLKPGGKLVIMDGNLLSPSTFKEFFIDRAVQRRSPLAGFRWLIGKHRVLDSFGKGWKGKDEDVKSIFWWRRALSKVPQLAPVAVTTTLCYRRMMSSKFVFPPLCPFAGRVIVVARKTERRRHA